MQHTKSIRTGNTIELGGWDRVVYRPPLHNRTTKINESRDFIGLDTEAHPDGRCFLICTSEGDTWNLKDFPGCLFGRKYRNTSFVVWNLRYDSGALLQNLSKSSLSLLWKDGTCHHGGFKYVSVGYKCLTITRGKNAVHIYDLWGFFGTSLEKASQTYLGEGKSGLNPKLFTRSWVRSNFEKVSAYCQRDALLTRDLGRLIVKDFESFGVFPRKLYSTAHVSWTYFRKHCPYEHVKRFWDRDTDVLKAACSSYNGGKFEVTRKGTGTFYELDIVSAYPAQIADLVSIQHARISRKPVHQKDADYGFVDCTLEIPFHLKSPIVVKRNGVCTFPVGRFRRWITKNEYEWAVRNGCGVEIHRAVWLHNDKREYPYRHEIRHLMEEKKRIKKSGDLMRYQTVKIFLNSLYGKFVQMIPKHGRLEAGAAWNPVFAAFVTSNVRIQLAEAQNKFPSICAVHTDSLISSSPLPIQTGHELGEWEESVSGTGVLLGSGVYQIGSKSKFRGFHTKKPLLEILPRHGNTWSVKVTAPRSWREVAFRELDIARINRFETTIKKIRPDFDSKRIWLEDWKSFRDVRRRNVDSLPLPLIDGTARPVPVDLG